MKKPIYNEFERYVILKTDSYFRVRLVLKLTVLKIQRSFRKSIGISFEENPNKPTPKWFSKACYIIIFIEIILTILNYI